MNDGAARPSAARPPVSEKSLHAPRKRSIWPFLVVGLILISMAADLTVCYIATSHPSLAAEVDYYRKSLVWDEQVTRERAFDEENWNVTMETLPVDGSAGERTLQLTLSEKDGSPVPGLQVELALFQSRRPDHRFERSLTEVAPGLYQARVPRMKRGLWPYSLTVLPPSAAASLSQGKGAVTADRASEDHLAQTSAALLHRGDFWVTR